MIKHDYSKLDDSYSKAAYKEDRLKIAKDLGYKYISQCTIELYRKFQSTATVAAILKVTPECVQYQLKKFGEPRIPAGGFSQRDKSKKRKKTG